MKQTVVLYNPYAVFYTMPLALIAIGSYLDASKYDVIIIDGRLEKNPLPLLAKALSKNAVCFATTVLTGGPIKDALKISRMVKQQFPNIPIVWGGWHPSLFPHQTLAEDCVDIIVKGQGETTFAELLIRLSNKEDLRGLPGIAYKEKGIVVMNDERHMQDINNFPVFNYNLIDVKAYMQLSGRRQLDYISSQGCRFRCSFCADPTMYKRGWYGYSPERMANEIETLWKQYQFDHVHLQDETFFTNSKRVKGVAEAFIKRKLPITWFGTMRADQGVRLDDEVWQLCKQSGLERVMIGMEAGTQEMLDWIQKDIKLHHIYETAEKCIKYGIAINFSIIVGFPGETEDSITETLRMVKELRKMSSTFNMGIFYYKPYPGNKIADKLIAENYHFPTTLEEWSDFDFVDTHKSDWVSDKMIEEIEGFKFYQQLAYNKPTPVKYIFQQVAKWRVENRQYNFPIEKKIKEWLMPKQKMA
jgi:radical SAM superfamily enzyme YgiQ (UPF0313 family)